MFESVDFSPPFAALPPDLSVTDLTVSVATGDSFSVHASLENRSASLHEPTKLSFYGSDDATYNRGDKLLMRFAISPMEAGSNRDYDFLLNPKGYKYLIAKADSLDAIAELNEANNIGAVRFDTKPVATDNAPDLTISDVTLSQQGEYIGGTLNVNNIGKGKAQASTALLYLSKDKTLDGGDYQIGRMPISPLAPQQSQGWNTTFKKQNFRGKYYLIAVADSPNKITESNENNNLVFKSLFIK